MSNLSSLTAAQLNRAADLKEKIEALNRELAAILSEAAPASESKPGRKARKKISAAGIARMKAAAKGRWAKIQDGQSAPTTKPVKKAKRKMSAEGRAKIIAAQKARWAKIKAEKAA